MIKEELGGRNSPPGSNFSRGVSITDGTAARQKISFLSCALASEIRTKAGEHAGRFADARPPFGVWRASKSSYLSVSETVRRYGLSVL
jgi:hypothetical protein